MSLPVSLSFFFYQFSMNTSFPPPITENRPHLGVPPPAGFIEGHAVSQQLLFCSSSIDTTGLTLYRGPAPTLLPYLTQFTNRHGHLTVYECPYEPAFIQKRNERERQRVKCVNQGYAKLRQHLPGQNADKRLSKVETLRAAISYIKYLQSLVQLEDTNGTNYKRDPSPWESTAGAQRVTWFDILSASRRGRSEEALEICSYTKEQYQRCSPRQFQNHSVFPD